MVTTNADKLFALSDIENEEVDKFYKRLEILDSDQKIDVVYTILEKPIRKDLKNPIFIDLLNVYYSMNELQCSEVRARASAEYDLSKNRDRWNLISNYDGSKFIDKIKMKLLGNKEISFENIKSLSSYFFDRGIVRNFENYHFSDLLVASGNLKAVQFLTTHNHAYKRPEVLERMLAIANIQKENDIISYLSDNFELKMTKVIDGKIKTVSVMVPDRNKILARMVAQPLPDNENKNGFKIKQK